MWEPGKPTSSENEYFARRDAEWLRERRAALDAERTARETHLVCPRCQGQLSERAIHNVRVDVCDACNGLWLDTGELEMLLHVPGTDLQRLAHDTSRGTK